DPGQVRRPVLQEGDHRGATQAGCLGNAVGRNAPRMDTHVVAVRIQEARLEILPGIELHRQAVGKAMVAQVSGRWTDHRDAKVLDHKGEAVPALLETERRGLDQPAGVGDLELEGGLEPTGDKLLVNHPHCSALEAEAGCETEARWADLRDAADTHEAG